MVAITSKLSGGGTGFDFSQLVDTVTAGSNISLSSSAADRTLTINAVGNFPAGGAIAAASDFSASGSLTDGQFLVFSGSDFTNRSLSGDATLTNSGKIVLSENSVSGNKVASKGIQLSKLNSTGGNSGDILVASASNTVSTIAQDTLIANTLSAGDNVSITTESNKVVISAGTDAEQVRDVIGAYLAGGDNVTVTRDDDNNTLTISADIGDDVTKEHVEDWVNDILVAGNNVTITHNDVANTITLSASMNTEDVHHIVQGYLVGGDNVLLHQDNSANALTISAIQRTDESVRDLVAGFVTAGSNVTITHDDDANTLTVSATGIGLDAEGVRDTVALYLKEGDNVSLNKNDQGNALTISAIPADGSITSVKLSSDVKVSSLADVSATTFSNGDLLIGSGSSLVKGRLQAGSNITLTDSNGSITISAAGGNIGGTVSLDDISNVSAATIATGTMLVGSGTTMYARSITGAWSISADGSTSLNESSVVASNIAASVITSNKFSSDVVVNSLNDVSATSFADGDLLIGSGATLVKGSISAGSNVNVTKESGSITISATQKTDEEVRDVVASFATAGDNITITHDDSADTLTVSATQRSDESIRDLVAGFITGGDNVTVTHDDDANTFTVSATAGGASNLTGLSDVTIASAASGHILIFDSTTAKNRAVSGDVTITVSGATSIGANKVVANHLSSDIKVSSLADVSATSFADGDMLIGSGASLVKGSISAGTNISVTKGSGVVTVANTLSALRNLSDVDDNASSFGGGDMLVAQNSELKKYSVSAAGGVSINRANNVITFSSAVQDDEVTTAKLSSDVKVSSLADVSATSFADGNLLIGSGTTLVKGSLSAGSNVTITNGSGVITISAAAEGGGSGQTAEQVRDLIGSTVIAGTNMSKTVDDDNDTVTLSATQKTDEEVRDVVAAFATAGDNVTITHDDTGDTLTFSATQRTDESVRDLVAGFVTGGDNVTVTHDDDNNTLTVSASSGGASNLTGLSDVTIASAASGNLLIFDGTTAKNRALSGDATISADGTLSLGAGKVDTANLSSDVKISSLADVASTASGFTDGNMLIASGSNLVKGTISAGTAVAVTNESGSVTISALQGLSAKTDSFDLSNDGVYIYDGDDPKTMAMKDVEAFIEPVHTKHVTLTDYTYTTNSLLADSQIKYFSNTRIIYFQIKSADRNLLDSIFTEHFRIRLQRDNIGDSGDEVYIEGIIESATWTLDTYYVIQLENASTSPFLSNGTFANTDKIKFISRGRHVRYADFIGHVGNLSSEVFKVPNTTAINSFVQDQVTNRSLGAIHSHAVITGVTSQTGLNLNTNKYFRWVSNHSTYSFYLNDTTFSPLSNYFKQGKYYSIYKSDGTILERGKIGAVSGSENVRSFVATERWVNSTEHHGSLSNITVDFQGELYYERREEQRKDKQKFLLSYGNRNINLSDSATTRLLTGGESTAARLWTDPGTGSDVDAVNHSLLPGTDKFLSVRVADGDAYTCTINFQGVFYNREASDTPRHTGLEVGLQFRTKDITSSTWTAWRDCTRTDRSESSTLVYKASNFGADSEIVQTDNATSDNDKFKSIFRTKGVLYAATNVISQHADVSPPGGWDFSMGLHPLAAFPATGKDYQFRFVYGSCGGSSLGRIYNRQEKIICDRILL